MWLYTVAENVAEDKDEGREQVVLFLQFRAEVECTSVSRLCPAPGTSTSRTEVTASERHLEGKEELLWNSLACSCITLFVLIWLELCFVQLRTL